MGNHNRIFRKSPAHSDLLKNTSILVSGTALAQLIPILLQPVLRRFYSPETFGAYTVYLSLIGILIVVSSFKYELAVILPKKDKEAANVLFLSQFLNLLFNVLLVFVIIIWGKRILDFLNLLPDFTFYLYIVPLGTFLYNAYQGINYWLIRKKGFFAISLNKFVRRGFEGSAQVLLKMANVSFGLILGDIIGHLANISAGIYQGIKKGFSFRMISFIKTKYVLRKYSDYPKFNVIPSFMSACSYLLPAVFINKFFSSEHAGFFDLSKLVLSIPLALIATSLSNVLLQRISEKFRNKESFVRELLPVLSIVLAISIAEIIVIIFFAVDLFKLFFGEQWEISGRISKILVWSFAFNFFVSSFSSIFISMNKIKLLSIWQLFYFLSILSLSFFKNYEFTNFLQIYVFIEIICCIIITMFMISIVLRYENARKAHQ